jgi:8-oxo-dGTP pyrophosphatase MutT (NUDIX family)
MTPDSRSLPLLRTMIGLSAPGASFGLRVVAVAIRDGHVLIHRSVNDDFWALPGGRCDLLETTHAALCREMREELGTEIRVERLLWICPNRSCTSCTGTSHA